LTPHWHNEEDEVEGTAMAEGTARADLKGPEVVHVSGLEGINPDQVTNVRAADLETTAIARGVETTTGGLKTVNAINAIVTADGHQIRIGTIIEIEIPGLVEITTNGQIHGAVNGRNVTIRIPAATETTGTMDTAGCMVTTTYDPMAVTEAAITEIMGTALA
jgi:hypothetical protein